MPRPLDSTQVRSGRAKPFTYLSAEGRLTVILVCFSAGVYAEEWAEDVPQRPGNNSNDLHRRLFMLDLKLGPQPVRHDEKKGGDNKEQVIVIKAPRAGTDANAPAGCKKQSAEQRRKAGRKAQENVDNGNIVLPAGRHGMHNVTRLRDAVTAMEQAPQKEQHKGQHPAGRVVADEYPAKAAQKQSDMRDCKDKAVAEPVGQFAPGP